MTLARVEKVRFDSASFGSIGLVDVLLGRSFQPDSVGMCFVSGYWVLRAQRGLEGALGACFDFAKRASKSLRRCTALDAYQKERNAKAQVRSFLVAVRIALTRFETGKY